MQYKASGIARNLHAAIDAESGADAAARAIDSGAGASGRRVAIGGADDSGAGPDFCAGQAPIVGGGAVARFVALAFALGCGFQLAAMRAGLRGPGSIWLFLAMWSPAAAALLAGRDARRAVRAGLRWPEPRWLAAGLALGMLPTIVKTLLLAATGAGAWDAARLPLAPHGGGIAGVHQLGMVLGVGAQSWAWFALNMVVTILVASLLLGGFGGLGEELGWRGVLQPALARRLGPAHGTLAVAAIWAAWHLPVNLAGYNDPVHPALTAWLIFPVAVACLSFVLAWLRRASGSVWPAALAHGANNVVATGLLIKANSWGADQWSGLAGMLLVGGLCAWRLVRMDAAHGAGCANRLPAADRLDPARARPVPGTPA